MHRIVLSGVLALVLGTLLISGFVWAFQLPASSEAIDLNPPKKPGGNSPKLKPQLQLVETALDNYAKNFKALEAALTAAEAMIRTLEQRGTAAEARIRTLEQRGPGGGLSSEQGEILGHMTIVFLPDGQGGSLKAIRISGVNVQIVNGLGATNGNPADPDRSVNSVINGLGNLIVGYQEFGPLSVHNRSGSHNVIVGKGNEYIGYGGIVVGLANVALAPFSSVTGGFGNLAAQGLSTITGGSFNSAQGLASSISGGTGRIVSGDDDWRAGDLFQDQ